MESDHKYLITAAKITDFFAVGAVPFAPARGQLSSPHLTRIKVDSTEAESLGCPQTQCPYCGCPYLYSLRETGENEYAPVIVLAHACPSESEAAGREAGKSFNRRAPVLVDVSMPGYHSRN